MVWSLGVDGKAGENASGALNDLSDRIELLFDLVLEEHRSRLSEGLMIMYAAVLAIFGAMAVVVAVNKYV